MIDGRAIITAGLHRVVAAIEAEALAITPIVTGNLQQSIFSTVNEGQMSGEVGASSEYALFVHQGTGIYGPHKTPIMPVEKDALFWKGAPHPMYSVKGMKGRPFMTEAIEKVNIAEEFLKGAESAY